MQKMSREKIEAELDLLQVPHSDEMSYEEIWELYKEKSKKPEPVIEVPEVPLGLSTINDHEYRLRSLEARVKILEKENAETTSGRE
jgi:hypothetical protein